MGNLLSSTNNRVPVTDVDRALLALRSQRRKLEQMRGRLLTCTQDQASLARTQLASGQRSQALFTLKRKRLQEHQLGRLDGWLLNVEEMLANVEGTVQQGNMLAALQKGNAALRQLQQEVSLEDIERLMEETASAAEHQARVNQLLGESWTGQDEEAAELELDALEGDLAAASIADLPVPPVVPAGAAGADRSQLPRVPSASVEAQEMLSVPGVKMERQLAAAT